MKTFGVTLPFAGHLYIEVEAENEKAAIAKAFDEATADHIQDWESLQRFNQGNVCYCPSPWEADAVCVDGDDTDEE